MKNASKIRRLDHKFRFQLLVKWLTENYKPCKAADVGGGKGLLALLLNNSGWKCEVIDPCQMSYITKYKNLDINKQIKVDKKECLLIPRRKRHFEAEMAKDYEILIGLHAHGSNMKIIDACKMYGKKFVLLPCCVVGEPIEIKPNIDWLKSLIQYSNEQGFDVGEAELNFKGQNKIIFSR